MRLDLILLVIIITSTFACRNEATHNQIPVSEYQYLLTEENLNLEKEYEEMLLPIIALKSNDPKVYWFIVSWLKTNYATPTWTNYNLPEWKSRTKQRGIDCSGFARVMQQDLFNTKIRGGSNGILNEYCERKKLDDLILGDLVFFRAQSSKNDNIVHVGVYLMNSYFVHATSKKSASLGLGLNISSLDEKNWKTEFVTGGEVKK